MTQCTLSRLREWPLRLRSAESAWTRISTANAPIPSLRFPHQLDVGLRIELADLVGAWYLVGAHSGFGRYLSQLHDVEFDCESDGETAIFRVVGSLTREALDVLVRCLTDSDIDVITESVVVTVTEYE